MLAKHFEENHPELTVAVADGVKAKSQKGYIDPFKSAFENGSVDVIISDTDSYVPITNYRGGTSIRTDLREGGEGIIAIMPEKKPKYDQKQDVYEQNKKDLSDLRKVFQGHDREMNNLASQVDTQILSKLNMLQQSSSAPIMKDFIFDDPILGQDYFGGDLFSYLSNQAVKDLDKSIDFVEGKVPEINQEIIALEEQIALISQDANAQNDPQSQEALFSLEAKLEQTKQYAKQQELYSRFLTNFKDVKESSEKIKKGYKENFEASSNASIEYQNKIATQIFIEMGDKYRHRRFRSSDPDKAFKAKKGTQGPARPQRVGAKWFSKNEKAKISREAEVIAQEMDLPLATSENLVKAFRSNPEVRAMPEGAVMPLLKELRGDMVSSVQAELSRNDNESMLSPEEFVAEYDLGVKFNFRSIEEKMRNFEYRKQMMDSQVESGQSGDYVDNALNMHQDSDRVAMAHDQISREMEDVESDNQFDNSMYNSGRTIDQRYSKEIRDDISALQDLKQKRWSLEIIVNDPRGKRTEGKPKSRQETIARNAQVKLDKVDSQIEMLEQKIRSNSMNTDEFYFAKEEAVYSDHQGQFDEFTNTFEGTDPDFVGPMGPRTDVDKTTRIPVVDSERMAYEQQVEAHEITEDVFSNIVKGGYHEISKRKKRIKVNLEKGKNQVLINDLYEMIASDVDSYIKTGKETTKGLSKKLAVAEKKLVEKEKEIQEENKESGFTTLSTPVGIAAAVFGGSLVLSASLKGGEEGEEIFNDAVDRFKRNIWKTTAIVGTMGLAALVSLMSGKKAWKAQKKDNALAFSGQDPDPKISTSKGDMPISEAVDRNVLDKFRGVKDKAFDAIRHSEPGQKVVDLLYRDETRLDMAEKEAGVKFNIKRVLRNMASKKAVLNAQATYEIDNTVRKLNEDQLATLVERFEQRKAGEWVPDEKHAELDAIIEMMENVEVTMNAMNQSTGNKKRVFLSTETTNVKALWKDWKKGSQEEIVQATANSMFNVDDFKLLKDDEKLAVAQEVYETLYTNRSLGQNALKKLRHELSNILDVSDKTGFKEILSNRENTLLESLITESRDVRKMKANLGDKYTERSYDHWATNVRVAINQAVNQQYYGNNLWLLKSQLEEIENGLIGGKDGLRGSWFKSSDLYESFAKELSVNKSDLFYDERGDKIRDPKEADYRFLENTVDLINTGQHLSKIALSFKAAPINASLAITGSMSDIGYNPGVALTMKGMIDWAASSDPIDAALMSNAVSDEVIDINSQNANSKQWIYKALEAPFMRRVMEVGAINISGSDATMMEKLKELGSKTGEAGKAVGAVPGAMWNVYQETNKHVYGVAYKAGQGLLEKLIKEQDTNPLFNKAGREYLENVFDDAEIDMMIKNGLSGYPEADNFKRRFGYAVANYVNGTSTRVMDMPALAKTPVGKALMMFRKTITRLLHNNLDTTLKVITNPNVTAKEKIEVAGKAFNSLAKSAGVSALFITPILRFMGQTGYQDENLMEEFTAKSRLLGYAIANGTMVTGMGMINDFLTQDDMDKTSFASTVLGGVTGRSIGNAVKLGADIMDKDVGLGEAAGNYLSSEFVAAKQYQRFADAGPSVEFGIGDDYINRSGVYSGDWHSDKVNFSLKALENIFRVDPRLFKSKYNNKDMLAKMLRRSTTQAFRGISVTDKEKEDILKLFEEYGTNFDDFSNMLKQRQLTRQNKKLIQNFKKMKKQTLKYVEQMMLQNTSSAFYQEDILNKLSVDQRAAQEKIGEAQDTIEDILE
jgi:hypothetical protein